MSFLDLTDVKEDEFSVLPAGEYLVKVTNAVVKDTKHGDGKYIETELVVTQGEGEGRKLWERFNIQNPNEKAVEIGKKQLKKLLVSAGANPVLSDVNELCGLTAVANVAVKTDPQWGDSNEVRFFRAPNGATTTAPAGVAQNPTTDDIPF